MTSPDTAAPAVGPCAQELRENVPGVDLQGLMASFPQGAVMVFDPDLRYVLVGGSGMADVGLSKETLQGNTVSEVFPPDVATVLEPRYRQALAGGESRVDVHYQGRIYLQQLGPLRDADDRIVAGVGFTQDVTRARRAERELQQSEKRLRSVFDHGLIPMALVTLDGRYERFNPAMCTFTGYVADELLELTDGELTHPDDIDADLAALAGALADGPTTYSLDKRYLTGAGEIAWGTKSATLVRGDGGEPLHVIVQIQDITARKRQDEVLADERRLRRDAEAIGRVGSWTLNVPTQAVYWSDGLLELYGLDVDAFDGNYAAALDCVHPADRAVIDEKVVACATTGQSLHGRYRIVRATDGALRWIELKGEAQYENGVIAQVCGAVMDITDHVTAEAEAAAARSFQQAVLDASPDVISVYDLVNRTIDWSNRSIPELLGYSAADLVAPTAPVRLVSPADRDRLDAALAAAQAAVDDAVIDIDYRMITKSGATRWFTQRTAPLRRNQRGEVTHIVGVLHDTTDERAAQAALEQSEALFRQLGDSVDVAFVLRSWDPSVFLYVNPAFKKIFGHDPMQDEDARSTEALIHPDDAEAFRANYLVPAAAGHPAHAEYRIIRPDQQVRWLRSKIAPVPDSWGNHRRTASTTEDITASHDAQAAIIAANAAERANTAKNEFLSRMSHELRTPLNAVLGFAQLLELDDLRTDQVQSVRHILRGGRHLLGLIDDVLDISKIEADRLEMSLELVPVTRLITEIVDLMAPQSAAANVQLHYEPGAAADRPVRADHRRLRQVVLNLLSNAIKYNRSGGEVEIRCALTTATHLDIIVRDNGRGIRAEHLPRLFVPFDRLDAATSDIEGTGVGLALSHRLMTLMGGSLTATSEFGTGSVFIAAIPLAAEVATDLLPIADPPLSQDAAPDGTELPARRMLYVEDNSSNIELMERLVARRPHWAMIVAGHGALGLELATSSAPDLVLLDLHLPDMNGIDVLRQLRSNPRSANLAVVVISADANPNQIHRLLAAGAHAYLTKPLVVSDVLAVLDSVDDQGIAGEPINRRTFVDD